MSTAPPNTQSNAHLQQQSTCSNSNFRWTRNPVNNSDEGSEFEHLLRVATFLTLQRGQELACEIKEAGKFDDLVVEVKNDGYYLRQIKHKQDKNFTIKKDNMFQFSSDMFNLDKYLASFGEICNKQPFAGQFPIKEITLTTNVGFDSSLRLLFDREKPSKVWAPLNSQHKWNRYKFKQSWKNLNDLKTKLKNPKKLHMNVVDKFLKTIVFEVNHPDIEDLKNLIKASLRSLIPLELDEDTAEKAFEFFKQKSKHFFDNILKVNSDWANIELRQKLLFETLVKLRDDKKLGTLFSYECRELVSILNSIGPIEFPPEARFETIIKRNDYDALNIFVPLDVTIPKLTSCKVLSYFKRQHPQLNASKLWMVKVQSEEDGNIVVNMFKHSNAELFKETIFAVEFTKELCKNDTTSQKVTDILSSLKTKNLRKLIFITNQKMSDITASEGSFEEIVDVLSFGGLTDAAHKFLSQKLLPLKNGKSVSLVQLGINIIKLDSLSLSELVLADANSQIDLLLPAYDGDVDNTYVRRKLKLPVIVDLDLDRDRLCFSWNDYDRKIKEDPLCSIYLLRSLKQLKISKIKSGMLFLLTKANNALVEDLRNNLNQSSRVEVDEHILISDNALFEKSRGVKGAIIVDLPGMGKSTLLTHLCNTLLKGFRDRGMEELEGSIMPKKSFVVRVNLGGCSSTAWNTTVENETDLIQFFTLYQQNRESTNPNSRLTALSKRILEEIFKGGSSFGVIVMLDGFDEISDRGRHFVTEKLIRPLLRMEGVERIIVASRPDGGVHEKLEALFNQFAFHFVKLDRKNQEEILVALWQKLIKEDKSSFRLVDNDVALKRCRKFAAELVFTARKQLSYEDRTILDIPLQCILFAECFSDDLKSYVNNAAYEFDKRIDVLGLFRTFFNRKFDILLNEKDMIEVKNDRAHVKYHNKQKVSLKKKAMRVSVHYMTRNMRKAEALLCENWNVDKFKKYMENMKEIGLVANFNDEARTYEHLKFELIHRTFAEYFTANYLILVLTEPDTTLGRDRECDRETYKVILDILLWKSEYEGVRRFFNRMVQSLSPKSKHECPFSIEDRTNAVIKWPFLGVERFNDYVAQHFDSSFFQTAKDGTFSDTAQVILLALCLKEYVVRSSMISFIKRFTKHLLDFFDNTIPYRLNEHSELVFALLKWYDYHPTATAAEKICLRESFFSCIEKLISIIEHEFSSTTQLLVAVTYAVDFQLRLDGVEEKLFEIVQRIFSKSCQMCVATKLIRNSDLDVTSVCSKLLDGVERGEYSLRFNSDWKSMFLRKIVEFGSPKIWAGKTSSLEIQIDWFLCVKLSDRFTQKYINSFLVICVGYFLLMIDRYMKNDERKANDYLRRVIRQALRLDVRILKWLQHVRPFWKLTTEHCESATLVDHEKIAITRAIKLLPEAHQAVHYGDKDAIMRMSQMAEAGTSFQRELFEWNALTDNRYYAASLSPSMGDDSDSSESDTLSHGHISSEMTLVNKNAASCSTANDDDNTNRAELLDSNLLPPENKKIKLENSNSKEKPKKIPEFKELMIRAASDDWIPPALYLAAANHDVGLCQEGLKLLANKDHRKFHLEVFVSHCIEYALRIINNESLVFPFLDVALAQLTKDEFIEIFPRAYPSRCFEEYDDSPLDPEHERYLTAFVKRTFTDRNSVIYFTLAKHSWVKLSIGLSKSHTSQDEAIRFVCKIIAYAIDQDEYVCTNVLLSYALEIAREAGIIHQEFYSRVGHFICSSLLKLSSIKFHRKKWDLYLRTILSAVWENVEEQDFVFFVCGRGEFVFDKSNTRLVESLDALDSKLLNDVVQEFIPKKLTARTSTDVLVRMITAADDDGRCWLNLLLEETHHARRNDFFKTFVTHLLNMDDASAVCFEQLSKRRDFGSSIEHSSFIIELLYHSENEELAGFLQDAMSTRHKHLLKRAEILQLYNEEIIYLGEFLKVKFNNSSTFLSDSWSVISANVRSQISQIELKKLEDYFGDDFCIDDSPTDEFFNRWTDVAQEALKYLHDQVSTILNYPERENVLSAFCRREDTGHSEKDIVLLLAALTFIRELDHLSNQPDNQKQQVNQLISYMRELKDFNDYFHDNRLMMKLQKREFAEVLDCCLKRLREGLSCTTLCHMNDDNTHELVVFLVDVALKCGLMV